MASTNAKAIRRAGVLQRLSDRLGIQQADLTANAKGDSELALIITLERVADALDTLRISDSQHITDTNEQAQQRGDLRSVIAAATDDELVAIPGIGEKSLGGIREWATQEPEQPAQKATDAAQGDEGTTTPQGEENTQEAPPVTVETVQEGEMQTVETVETVPVEDAPNKSTAGTPKGKAK